MAPFAVKLITHNQLTFGININYALAVTGAWIFQTIGGMCGNFLQRSAVYFCRTLIFVEVIIDAQTFDIGEGKIGTQKRAFFRVCSNTARLTQCR